MSVLLLPDAKSHLRMKQDDNDTGLQDVIDQAESRVAELVGPLTVGDPVTVRVAGGTQLILPAAPVGTVTSITTPDGQTVDTSLVTVDQASGLAYFTDDLTMFSNDVYDVTFTAGWAAVPAGLLWAIKECVREMWFTQRGNSPAAAGAGPGKTGWEMAAEPYRFARVSAA